MGEQPEHYGPAEFKSKPCMPIWATILIVVLAIGAATAIIFFCVLGKDKSANGNPNTISTAARQPVSPQDAAKLLEGDYVTTIVSKMDEGTRAAYAQVQQKVTQSA